jgi:hypothetical protein
LNATLGDAGEIGAQRVTLIVEPVFRQSARFHEKKGPGVNPDSL